MSPAAPHRVFAGTRGDGVWVSEDYGVSWRKPCFGRRGPGKVRSVALDPSNPNRVYAGTEPIDLFVSEDAAKSWTRLDSATDEGFQCFTGGLYAAPQVALRRSGVGRQLRIPSLFAGRQALPVGGGTSRQGQALRCPCELLGWCHATGGRTQRKLSEIHSFRLRAVQPRWLPDGAEI